MANRQLDLDTARKRLLSMPPEQRGILLRNCGEWRHVVKHVLINDMSPERYGRRFHCDAAAMLDVALQRLSNVMR